MQAQSSSQTTHYNRYSEEDFRRYAEEPINTFFFARYTQKSVSANNASFDACTCGNHIL